jgi:hypothetical protein
MNKQIAIPLIALLAVAFSDLHAQRKKTITPGFLGRKHQVGINFSTAPAINAPMTEDQLGKEGFKRHTPAFWRLLSLLTARRAAHRAWVRLRANGHTHLSGILFKRIWRHQSLQPKCTHHQLSGRCLLSRQLCANWPILPHTA